MKNGLNKANYLLKVKILCFIDTNFSTSLMGFARLAYAVLMLQFHLVVATCTNLRLIC